MWNASEEPKMLLLMLPYPYVNSSSFCHYFLIELEDLFKKLPKIYMYLKSGYDNIMFEYYK